MSEDSNELYKKINDASKLLEAPEGLSNAINAFNTEHARFKKYGLDRVSESSLTMRASDEEKASKRHLLEVAHQLLF